MVIVNNTENVIAQFNQNNVFVYKKSELMLTRHAKAYSSSCSQTASLSPPILLQFILGVRAAAEDHTADLPTMVK